MSEKKRDLPGDEGGNLGLIDCGTTVYGEPREESAEPAGPPDPEAEKRYQEELFRVMPVSPIVN